METELQRREVELRRKRPLLQLGLSVIKRKRDVEQAPLLSVMVLLSWLAVFTGSERRGRGATMS